MLWPNLTICKKKKKKKKIESNKSFISPIKCCPSSDLFCTCHYKRLKTVFARRLNIICFGILPNCFNKILFMKKDSFDISLILFKKCFFYT